MTDSRRQLRILVLVLLGVAVVLVVDQASLLASQLFPLRPRDLPWRFGAVGLVVSRTTALLLIDAILLFAVYVAQRTWASRTLGVVHFVVAAAVLVALGLFLLDAVEMRSAASREMLRPLTVQAARTVLVGALLAGFAVWAGVLLMRMRPAGAMARTRTEDGSLLVVGHDRRAEREGA